MIGFSGKRVKFGVKTCLGLYGQRLICLLECPLPFLSELLQNPRIQETDSFVICVQIHSPVGPYIPEQPSVAYVPRDLLDGLEASLDNPSQCSSNFPSLIPDAHTHLDTGDVRFVCLERLNPEIHSNVPRRSPKLEAGLQHRPPSSSSSHSTFSSATTARKRIIYAHSDILTRRSEYFATMLSSAFAEGAEPPSGERRVYTVIVEEADFETMYWLLKFCYTNWLLFREQDDPRAAVEGVGAGWSARWLASRNGEWDWKTLSSSGDETLMDAKSATSGESRGAAMTDVSRSTSRASETFRQSAMTAVVNTTTSGTAMVKVSPSSSSSAHQRSRRPMSSTSTLPVSVGGSSSPSRSKPEPPGLSTNRYATAAPPKHYPISPRTSRSQQPPLISALDPHPHPAPQPPPASALSMYQVAHRYTMPGLADLALEHMMATMTPQSSFSLLLATATWDELHILVQVSIQVASNKMLY